MTLGFIDFISESPVDVVIAEGPVKGYSMTGAKRGKPPKKVRKWFCPPGQKRQGRGPDKPPKCLPKSMERLHGSAKIRRKFANIKSVRTKKAKGDGYKARVGMSIGMGLKARKRFGLRNQKR